MAYDCDDMPVRRGPRTYIAWGIVSPRGKLLVNTICRTRREVREFFYVDGKGYKIVPVKLTYEAGNAR